jgi:predicted PhzF superfamily epimerase YddE/YHI9
MEYQCDWIDAFTDRAFGGNGCAVAHDALDLGDDQCCAFGHGVVIIASGKII